MYVIVEEGPAIFVLVSLMFTGTIRSKGCFPRHDAISLSDIDVHRLTVHTHPGGLELLIPTGECRWGSTKPLTLPAFAYNSIVKHDHLLIAVKQLYMLHETLSIPR